MQIFWFRCVPVHRFIRGIQVVPGVPRYRVDAAGLVYLTLLASTWHVGFAWKRRPCVFYALGNPGFLPSRTAAGMNACSKDRKWYGIGWMNGRPQFRLEFPTSPTSSFLRRNDDGRVSGRREGAIPACAGMTVRRLVFKQAPFDARHVCVDAGCVTYLTCIQAFPSPLATQQNLT